MRRALAAALATIVACASPVTIPNGSPATTGSQTARPSALTATATPTPTPTPSPRLGPAVVENVQLIASGLEVPWAVAQAPDGRLFVTERPGRVRIVRLGGGGLQPQPWANVPARANPDAERGLLGIALDPDFARNGFVYLY
jgi:glucose/arabinose dehydrogenase